MRCHSFTGSAGTVWEALGITAQCAPTTLLGEMWRLLTEPGGGSRFRPPCHFHPLSSRAVHNRSLCSGFTG